MEDFSEQELTEFFEYLDALRASGITNMGGAVPFLQGQFEDITDKSGREVLKLWMFSFSDEPAPARARSALAAA